MTLINLIEFNEIGTEIQKFGHSFLGRITTNSLQPEEWHDSNVDSDSPSPATSGGEAEGQVEPGPKEQDGEEFLKTWTSAGAGEMGRKGLL